MSKKKNVYSKYNFIEPNRFHVVNLELLLHLLVSDLFLLLVKCQIANLSAFGGYFRRTIAKRKKKMEEKTVNKHSTGFFRMNGQEIEIEINNVYPLNGSVPV